MLKSLLEKFDKSWCDYEMAYIKELIVIENDARRYLVDLKNEVGNNELFVQEINKINAVANHEG